MMLVTVQMYGQNLRHDDHTEDDVGTEMMDSQGVINFPRIQ